MVKNLHAMREMGDLGSIPGLGRSPEGGHDNPLQYSCLENPMRIPEEPGRLQSMGLQKSQTRLSDFHFIHLFKNQQSGPNLRAFALTIPSGLLFSQVSICKPPSSTSFEPVFSASPSLMTLSKRAFQGHSWWSSG